MMKYSPQESFNSPNMGWSRALFVFLLCCNSGLWAQKDTVRLQTIVVSAGRYAQRMEQTTVSIDVLSPSILKNKPLLKIEDALIQVPGVTIQDGQANIRSGSGWSYGVGSRVQVLLDGLPLLSPDAATASWSLIPVEAMSQVEVVKGAASALYGSAALNGVMNIRTLEPGSEWVVRASVQSTVYDQPERRSLRWWEGTGPRTQGTMRFAIGKKIKKVGFLIHGQGLWDEGYQYAVTEKSARFNAKVDYEPIKGLHIGTQASVRGLKGATSLLWSDFRTGYIPLDSTATNQGIYQLTVSPYIIYRKGRSVHSLRTRFMAHNNHLTAGLEDYSNAARTGYSEYTFHHYGTKGLHYTVGVSGTRSISLNSVLFGGPHTAASNSVFGQWDKMLGAWNFSLGARVENYVLDTSSATGPVFRAGVNRKIAKGLHVRSSAGQGFRYPTIAEAYTVAQAGPVKVFPNPLARAERGYTAEIGIKQMLQSGRASGYLDLALFTNHYDDMLEFTFGQWTPAPIPTLANFGFKSINVGPAQMTGIELTASGRYDATEAIALQGMLGYTYTHPVALKPDSAYMIDAAGTPVSYASTSMNTENNYLKYRYRHVAKADVEILYNQWSAGTSVRFNNRMDNMDELFVSALFNTLVPGVRDAYEYFLPHYDLLIDARLKYQSNKDLSFTFQVNNLLNQLIMPRPAALNAPRTWGVQITYALDGR